MKEKFKNYWKRNGFYMVLTAALVVVLGISGIAGYRSGIKDKVAAQNAAQFNQAEHNVPESVSEGNTVIENGLMESTENAEAANAEVAETFGSDAEMVWPVEGEILKEFSMDTTVYFETLDQYRCNPALLIKADVNQEVVAAFGGIVESVTEDSVNGTMITVNLGNGYKTVYGQMKDVKIKEGDVIVKGQSIGTVSQPTKYFAEEGSHLYFGMTKDNAPMDPSSYL